MTRSETSGTPEPSRQDHRGVGPAGNGSPWEVLRVFLRLGLTSFGGPVAHLGYFRTEFVERRKWLDDRGYADLVALCQFLPGPASSQVGMAIGFMRARWIGALLAWLGFTAPSAIALIVFGLGVSRWAGLADSGALRGLKVAAVAVVAQAVWSMGRSLCPDRTRALLAVATALVTLSTPGSFGQIGAIAASGLVGLWLVRLPVAPHEVNSRYAMTKTAGAICLAVFFVLLLGLPVLAAVSGQSTLSLFDGFYRAGALVFGGGHVVLPLLQSTVVPGGAVSNSEFLAGYGAAQAVPGPLFTFAAYLGAVMHGPVHGVTGGVLFLLAIFLPAFLLVMGALPFWDALRQKRAVQSALAGINAGVVGVLLAALYDPVWTSAIHGRTDFGLTVLVFGLLTFARTAPWIAVFMAGLVGQLML